MQNFHQHFRQVHREKNFQCAECARLFPSKFFLECHLKVCYEYVVIEDDFIGKIYKCKTCEKKFSNSNEIIQHLHYVHKERKFKCEKCDRLFPF